MKPDIEIVVRLWPEAGEPRGSPHGPDVQGKIRQKCEASLTEDQEENAVRLAEQMVREAFARLRAHTHAVVQYRENGALKRRVVPIPELQQGDAAVFVGTEVMARERMAELERWHTS
jgi:hypothetical protein